MTSAVHWTMSFPATLLPASAVEAPAPAPAVELPPAAYFDPSRYGFVTRNSGEGKGEMFSSWYLYAVLGDAYPVE